MESKKRLKKKSREDYTEEAYLGIRRMFFCNEIIPGQKIAYGDLARRLGMSTTPVIQALKRLEFQGLVRHEPNKGYYTESISLKEIGEIYEFRELIELSLLPKTIARMTQGRLKKLKKALDNHRMALRDIYLKERLLRDMEFHMLLAELSGCHVQVKTLRSLFDILYLKYRGNILFVTPMEEVDLEHQTLYDSIANSDVKTAHDVLKQHISNVREHALTSIKKLEQEKSIQSV
ncbi:MAG: GntR family transcriptional regulator [Thermodesulfobacteriota bacterium]|nr:GntR family transcriptional regulator [Thermodesulfobacteriota bacterium]